MSTLNLILYEPIWKRCRFRFHANIIEPLMFWLYDLWSLRLSLLKSCLANMTTRNVLTLSKAMSAFLSASGMVPRASRYGYCNKKHKLDSKSYNRISSLDFFLWAERGSSQKEKKNWRKRWSINRRKKKTGGNIETNKGMKGTGGVKMKHN